MWVLLYNQYNKLHKNLPTSLLAHNHTFNIGSMQIKLPKPYAYLQVKLKQSVFASYRVVIMIKWAILP